MWPKEVRHVKSELMALVIVSESHSKTTFSRPRSLAKETAFLHAFAATSSTVAGRKELSESAPITSPFESLMTTPPMPAFCKSWNSAPSKFAL